MSLLLDENLKMTTKESLLVKLTERRVLDVRMGEIFDLLPKGTTLELKTFKTLFRQKEKMDIEAFYSELGALLYMMLFRIMEEEEQVKVNNWEDE